MVCATPDVLSVRIIWTSGGEKVYWQNFPEGNYKNMKNMPTNKARASARRNAINAAYVLADRMIEEASK